MSCCAVQQLFCSSSFLCFSGLLKFLNLLNRLLVTAALCIDQCCVGECAHLCALCCVKGDQKRLFDSKVSEISRLSSRLDQLTEQNNVLHRELEEVGFFTTIVVMINQ
jgi:hypothetical protein